MGADTVRIPWEAYDKILAEARERNQDVMRDAWIMRARHAVAEAHELHATACRQVAAAERLIRLLHDHRGSPVRRRCQRPANDNGPWHSPQLR